MQEQSLWFSSFLAFGYFRNGCSPFEYVFCGLLTDLIFKWYLAMQDHMKKAAVQFDEIEID